jgi:hypothetical protein
VGEHGSAKDERESAVGERGSAKDERESAMGERALLASGRVLRASGQTL